MPRRKHRYKYKLPITYPSEQRGLPEWVKGQSTDPEIFRISCGNARFDLRSL
jgi:hypothetical protein